MTVLLVLFTLILFLVFDHFVQKRQGESGVPAHMGASAKRSALGLDISIPKDVSIATNHVWTRQGDNGMVTVGFDEFLGRILGVVESVTLPKENLALMPSTKIGVSVRGRSLRLDSPIAGYVVKTNGEVIKNPSLLLSDPYGKGWLMRVNSSESEIEQSRKFAIQQPVIWLKEQMMEVRDFLVLNSTESQPVYLQDGGIPIQGVLQQFDSQAWEKFGTAFATLHPVECGEQQEARS